MASGPKITLVVIVLIVAATGLYWATVGPSQPRSTNGAGPDGTTTGETEGSVVPNVPAAGERIGAAPADDRGFGRAVSPPTVPPPPPPVVRETPASAGDDAVTMGSLSRRPADPSRPIEVVLPGTRLVNPPTRGEPGSDPSGSPGNGVVDPAPGQRPPVESGNVVDDGGKDLPPATGGAGDGANGGARPANAPPATGPAAAPPPVERARRVPEPQPPAFTDHVVAEGETMTSIAAEWFGDAGKWDLIAKANPYVDPTRLQVGMTLRLPPKDAVRAAPEADPSVRRGDVPYLVKSGDTLSSIARTYYGDPAKWSAIYEANRETIGADPAALRVGMKLRIPPAGSGAD